MCRFSLIFGACCLSFSLAADAPLKIDRTIGKEPVYKSKAPKYGLLVFGPQAKDRIWLVLDGDTLYVDRNGDGDLTDPGEKIEAEKKAGRDPEEDGYTFEVGEVTVGGRTHKGLSVYSRPLKRYTDGSLGKRADVKAALAKDSKAVVVTVGIDVDVPKIKGAGVGGRVVFLAGPIDLYGPLQFSDVPGKAPAIRLGPPFEITFYSSRPTLRAGRESDFVLVVGSPGVGPGTFAMVGYEGTIPNDAKPLVELALPVKGKHPAIDLKTPIKDRC
jgi:hypothetical protein